MILVILISIFKVSYPLSLLGSPLPAQRLPNSLQGPVSDALYGPLLLWSAVSFGTHFCQESCSSFSSHFSFGSLGLTSSSSYLLYSITLFPQVFPADAMEAPSRL